MGSIYTNTWSRHVNGGRVLCSQILTTYAIRCMPSHIPALIQGLQNMYCRGYNFIPCYRHYVLSQSSFPLTPNFPAPPMLDHLDHSRPQSTTQAYFTVPPCSSSNGLLPAVASASLKGLSSSLTADTGALKLPSADGV